MHQENKHWILLDVFHAWIKIGENDLRGVLQAGSLNLLKCSLLQMSIKHVILKNHELKDLAQFVI